MKASVRFDTQIVGALPVILSYFDKLQVAATVDKLVPWEGEVPLGVLAEILMANRLLQPKAMVRIGQWAGRIGLTDYYGVTVEQLNDDRLGRALERLAQYGSSVEMALTLRAIKVFKVRVNQIHYDLTSAELFGAYEQIPTEGVEPPTPLPAYGHTKSGRKNVKQIQIGLNVSNDGGIPLRHAVFSGNVAEQTTHLANLRLLSSMLKKRQVFVHRRREAGHAGEPGGRRYGSRGIPLCRSIPAAPSGRVSLVAAQVVRDRLCGKEPSAPAARAARPVPGHRDYASCGSDVGRSLAADQVPADLHPQQRVGKAARRHTRASHGEDPRGVRERGAEPGQVQAEEDWKRCDSDWRRPRLCIRTATCSSTKWSKTVGDV